MWWWMFLFCRKSRVVLIIGMIVKHLCLSCESLAYRSFSYQSRTSQYHRSTFLFMSTTTTTTTNMIVEIHPLSSEPELIQLSNNNNNNVVGMKKVHFVRHAEGTHNVEKNYHCLSNFDARLTKVGEKQCIQLAQSLSSSMMMESVDLVVTSPLTRCIQTSLFCFSSLLPKNIPFVVHESIRETVNYHCDRRRSIQQLLHEFPTIDFSTTEEEEDGIWKEYEERFASLKDPNTRQEYSNAHRESAELYKVAHRGRLFFQWLSTRTERNIIVSTHSAFLRCILHWGHNDTGVPLAPSQHLDIRSDEEKKQTDTIPVVKFVGTNEFETFMRSDYANCEMRSFLLLMKHT